MRRILSVLSFLGALAAALAALHYALRRRPRSRADGIPGSRACGKHRPRGGAAAHQAPPRRRLGPALPDPARRDRRLPRRRDRLGVPVGRLGARLERTRRRRLGRPGDRPHPRRRRNHADRRPGRAAGLEPRPPLERARDRRVSRPPLRGLHADVGVRERPDAARPGPLHRLERARRHVQLRGERAVQELDRAEARGSPSRSTRARRASTARRRARAPTRPPPSASRTRPTRTSSAGSTTRRASPPARARMC